MKATRLSINVLGRAIAIAGILLPFFLIALFLRSFFRADNIGREWSAVFLWPCPTVPADLECHEVQDEYGHCNLLVERGSMAIDWEHLAMRTLRFGKVDVRPLKVEWHDLSSAPPAFIASKTASLAGKSVLGFGYYVDAIDIASSGGVRILKSSDDQVIVVVPLWSLILLTALPAAFIWVHRRRDRKRRTEGLCPACGYDLRASPARCPECGKVNVASVKEAQLILESQNAKISASP